MTATAALAPVGVFELRVHAARAEIELGRDPGSAQARDEPLIIRHRRRVAVEREHHDRPRRFRRGDDRALDRAQRRQAGARRRSRSRSPEPARRESARRARRSARRRRPSRSGSACRPRPASRRSARPRRPGRCNIRARARRRGRYGCGRDHSQPPERGSRSRQALSALRPLRRDRARSQQASVDRLDARRRRLVADAVAKLHSPIVGIDFEPGAIHEREHLFNDRSRQAPRPW